MDRLDLAEIRARLQAVEPEGRSARKPGFELAALWRARTAAPAPPRPVLPPPRRVGLPGPPEPEPETELLLQPPLELTVPIETRDDEDPAQRRNAFGQRREPVGRPWSPPTPPSPPSVVDEDVGEALRRIGSTLSRASRLPLETPDLLDDLDPPWSEPATPAAPRRLILRRTAEAVARPISPEIELLEHLERVFLAEHAGLEAHRLSA